MNSQHVFSLSIRSAISAVSCKKKVKVSDVQTAMLKCVLEWIVNYIREDRNEVGEF
jgi:hypothetical protein